jgi:predicted kinase
MPKLIILCGPSGAGKTSLAHSISSQLESDGNHFLRINQDDHTKSGHLTMFKAAIECKRNIVMDRLNFNKEQRARYLNPAKESGYETQIIVMHENYETCLKRCNARLDHPTITTEEHAKNALNMFFSKYERPTFDEADTVEYRYPNITNRSSAILVDIDGTAANIDHRLYFVDKKDGKKADWKSFFDNIHLDTPNQWCREIVNSMRDKNLIVFCSGRPDSLKPQTKKWLEDNKFFYDYLMMRPRADHRDDKLVKEIILDFEIKTRFANIKFAIDDRARVVDMWRSRGIVTLACAKGDF